MMEQLFHAWRSFHYDENGETIDTYMQRIEQVAEMLNCGKPQTLEVFKNTLPPWLHWALSLTDNLHISVDTAKRILNKERFNTQWRIVDIGTTCMGTSNMRRQDDFAEEHESTYNRRLLIWIQSYWMDLIFLDTGASKSFMFKRFYLNCTLVGNCQHVSVLYVITPILYVHGHKFEIYTLASEICGQCRCDVGN